MQIVAISDTHGKHRQVTPPAGDVLVHTGDITINGDKALTLDFVDWFSEQPFKHKIFIAGNHDRWAENAHHELELAARRAGVHYLCAGGITLDGVAFWGSPFTPEFMDWSFMLSKGSHAKAHWQQVPANTDVLLTHGPPAGILDELELVSEPGSPASSVGAGGVGSDVAIGDNHSVGCPELKARVAQIGVPLHIFGHIHEGYGELATGKTRFINASLMNNRYRLVNSPCQASVEPRSITSSQTAQPEQVEQQTENNAVQSGVAGAEVAEATTG